MGGASSVYMVLNSRKVALGSVGCMASDRWGDARDKFIFWSSEKSLFDGHGGAVVLVVRAIVVRRAWMLVLRERLVDVSSLRHATGKNCKPTQLIANS